jgi:hypothetical protein
LAVTGERFEAEGADLFRRWHQLAYAGDLSMEDAARIFADHPWTKALVWKRGDVIGDAVGRDGFVRQSVFMGLNSGAPSRWLGSTIITTTPGAFGASFGYAAILRSPVPPAYFDVSGLLDGKAEGGDRLVSPESTTDAAWIERDHVRAVQKKARQMLRELARWQGERSAGARAALVDWLGSLAARGVLQALPDFDPECDQRLWTGGLEACAAAAAQWLLKHPDRGPRLRICGCGKCDNVLLGEGSKGRPNTYWPGHAPSTTREDVAARRGRMRIKRTFDDAGHSVPEKILAAIHERYETVTNLRRAARQHDRFLVEQIPTSVLEHIGRRQR